MRHDMSDVLRGGRCGCSADYEVSTERRRDTRKYKLNPDGPKRDKMRTITRHGNVKTNVMNRFLQSRVGRKWDDVYSEISAATKKLSKEEMSWCLNYVHRHVQMRDGVPYITKGQGTHWLRKKEEDGWGPISDGHFYVDPRNGLLKRYREKWIGRPKKTPDRIVIDYYNQCVRENGIWYWWTWRPFVASSKQFWTSQLTGKTNETPLDYDFIRGDWISLEAARSMYSADVVGVSKKQMNKREIKKFIPRGVR